MRQLHIRPGTDNASAFAALLARVVAVGRPKALYEVSYLEDRGDESIAVSGVRFTSRALTRNLSAAERVFPYIVTCGTEADAVTVPDGDLMQALWLWTIKERLLDVAIDHLHKHIAGRYRLTHWAVMHPGSGDADVWPIEQQAELFSIFGDVESMIGVRLTQAMLMIPTMSVSGVVYLAETDFKSCQVCHREGCPRRRAPFDESVWRAACGD
jgi:hypothetical protein